MIADCLQLGPINIGIIMLFAVVFNVPFIYIQQTTAILTTTKYHREKYHTHLILV